MGFLLFVLLLIAALSGAEGLGPMVWATAVTLPIPMFPRRALSTMRRLPHLRQLRQIGVSDSHSSGRGLAVGLVSYFRSAWAIDPLPHFALAKSPLPADPEGRYLATLRPKAKSSG